MRLQRELTLTHLAVTALSMVIFTIGVLGGYAYFLRSHFSAIYAADLALIFADDFLIDVEQNMADPQAFVDFNILPVADQPLIDDWLLITDQAGLVIASNYTQRYPIGHSLRNDPPPGFVDEDFDHPAEVLSPEWANGLEAYYINLDGRHLGLAPLKNSDANWIGWLYLHLGQEDIPLLQQEMLQDILLAAVGLGLISVAISGSMGYFLSKRIGSRLNQLGKASAAFAAGRLEERVTITRQDEIGDLAMRYNKMADQIANQMGELRNLADENSKLASEAEALVRLEERNHLARELHDAVKQQIFGLNLALGSLPPLLETKPDLVKARIPQLIEQTQQIQVELDTIIKQLRPVGLSENGLVDSIVSLANRWQNQAGFNTEVKASQHRPLPLDIEQTLYRLTQEALQNCGKHAKAEQVTISIDYTQNEVSLTISDDGRGFEPQFVNGNGHGLHNMRKRVEEIGGQFNLKSRPGKGTSIQAVVNIN